METELTDKQRRFAEEYLIDLNSTQAAFRAGYSDANYGRQLLTIPNVLDYITLLRTQISSDRVL
jgi:phage terminase small subunit